MAPPKRRLLLVFVPIVLIMLGYTILLFFKVCPFIFSILIARLGVDPWLGLLLLIAACFGYLINFPLLILTADRFQKQRKKWEILPVWLFKRWCLLSYRSRYRMCSGIAVNLSGGLIPIILALHQFQRVPTSKILIVTAIVALISYPLVTVLPGKAIVTHFPQLGLIAITADLSATIVAAGGTNRSDVAVAFAGAVLGTTIGADLLHFKDVYTGETGTFLSIGGAGLRDGIALCGLCALVIAEWLPAIAAWVFFSRRGIVAVRVSFTLSSILKKLDEDLFNRRQNHEH